jgi:hypothetical protein
MSFEVLKLAYCLYIAYRVPLYYHIPGIVLACFEVHCLKYAICPC